jgi:hypothetical protein
MSNPPVSYPIVLHFNGNGPEKEKMYHVAAQMHWPSTPQVDLWGDTFFSVNHPNSSFYSSDKEGGKPGGGGVLLKDACEKVLPELACGKSVGDCLSRRQRQKNAEL